MGVVVYASNELRQTEKWRIVELLDASAFTCKEFDIIYGSQKDELFRINFNAQPEYQFVVQQITVLIDRHIGRKENHFTAGETPGKSQTTELTQYMSVGECISLVKDWANRIQAEFIEDNPAYKQFEAELERIKEEVYQLFAEHTDDLDAHFTEGEKEEWGKQLDRFEERIGVTH